MSKKQDKMIELRSKSADELIKIGEDSRAELFALKFQVAVGSVEKTDRISSLKKNIARIEFLLNERKIAGEEINRAVKADYAKAVEKAEIVGKEVRKKQKDLIEKLQAEQLGTNINTNDSESVSLPEKAIDLQAIANEAEADKIKAAEAKAEAQKQKLAEAEKAAAEVVKINKIKKASQKDAKVINVIKLEPTKPTGKGKAAIGEANPRKVTINTVQGENIQVIDLKLKARPKDSKTYTFGINAIEAKKQIEEAAKKSAEKNLEKKLAARSKGAKK